MRVALVAAAGLLAFAGYELAGQQASIQDAVDTASEIGADIVDSLTGYSPDKVPEIYRSAIWQAEQNHGLPDGMLARLLWQECRYKPAIIDGRKTSPAGALGIAQFMPATAAEMGINPLEPFQAIDAAARYLSSLHRQTGTWGKALAAYNWGIGNVKRKGISAAPLETRNYYQQIMADIGLGAYA